jgi:hypothetical protein
MTILNQISTPPPEEAEVIVNENFATLEHQSVYGHRPAGDSGLVRGYYGGRWGGFSISNGTLTLTASSDNYVVVAIATGVISVSTASTNWDNDTDYVRVYKITTGTSTVSSVEDHRAGPGGVHGGTSGGGGGAGTVTSVAVSVPSHLSVSGSPVTTSGTIAISYSGTALPVANGGTGGTSASGARTALGLAIGTDVQAYNARLADIAGITWAQGDILYHNGTSLVKLAAGTSGHYLQTQGAGANPQWAAASGGGSGGTKTYGVFTPMNSQPPATNFATLDTRNSIAVLDFDASTDEATTWVGVMPEAASLGSGLKVRIHWMATSATSGDVVWGAQIERMNTDLDSDSYDTAATATSTTNGTSGIATVTEITITTIDSVAAGELFRLRVYRDADSGSDTMTGDAELVAVELRSAA